MESRSFKSRDEVKQFGLVVVLSLAILFSLDTPVPVVRGLHDIVMIYLMSYDGGKTWLYDDVSV